MTTTKTANDSIGIVESRHQQSTTTTESMGDTLVLVAEADIGNRSFETDNAGVKYVLSENIGAVAGGLLDIIGATSKNNKSSIDMNDKQGFSLTNATDLVFNDVALGNALNDDLVNISNANAKVSLNNTNVSGNISGNTEYIMSITGTTSIDGIINNADATATNAILTFGTDTFADSKLTTDGSSIDFVDNVVNDYKIGTLNANGNSNWNIDVNLTDKSADRITSSDSDGTVYINKINNIGTIDEDIVIQVLKNTDNSDGLQLALNEDNIKVVEDGRNIGNEVYVSQNYIQEAGISLATTNTTNDSIKIYQGAIYNALVLINDKETSEERSYIFDEAGIQTLNEDLSSTTAGTLNIVGFNNDAESSVIDANGNTLFDLSNATTLNVSGVTLSNASGDAIIVSDKAELNLTNVLFENNGGNAITSSGNVNINVKDTDITMSENISMNNAVLSFNVENGTLNLSNEVSGSDYNLHLKGGNVKVSGSVSGVNNLEMSQSAILGLGTSGRISVGNMMHAQGTRNVSLQSNTSPTLQIDVDVANNRMTNGIIDVSGDVSGVYNVIVNALSTEYADGSSIFLTALQDDSTTSSEFSVLRVEGSPYMWKAVLNADGETEGSTWYLAMEKQEDPDEPEDPETPDNPDNPDNPVIDAVLSPEVIAGIGLHTAGIEQTRTVVRNVSGKVANAHSYCPNCGIVSDAWNGKQLNNGWVLAQGEYSNIDKPVDMEAKIWGVEGGFDMQSDMNNTFGIFASYRNGEYDLSGKGSRYRSNIGSEIEIDSYLAGLYYRYDKNMNWLFATVYGGTQEAEAKTDDGIASFETDGLEFGVSAEIGHSFALSDTTTLSPSLGVYYTQINYDDANDNVGKKYQWDDIKHLEAELGLSLAKNFENGKVYVRPSVIQTLTDDDKVSITGLNEADTYHDQTLGRVEIGGNCGFNDNWSAYGWANYTFGSSYDATSLGAGVNYSW